MRSYGFTFTFSLLNRRYARLLAPGITSLFIIAGLVVQPQLAQAQSTFATLLGTVRDPSGKVAAGALVQLTNKSTSAVRSEITNDSGGYAFSNVEPDTYIETITMPGFTKAEFPNVELEARETRRLDAELKVASQVATVNVQDTVGAPVNTDTSNIAESKTGRELVDLPVAITTRGTGSTSPLSTLTTQPGVQTDSSGNISVAGSKPSMLSMSIDGISSMGPRAAGPLTELFPSFNSIAEIRVSEINNTAEFAGISDITTISKSGSNSYHGGIFENLQNKALTARNPFSATKPQLIMNDYGAYVGGPVMLPKLYNGHDRTFFFASYEALRLPRQTVLVESVPSLALRSGNLSRYSAAVYAPGTGTPYSGNQIPASQISPLALSALKYLFPIPDAGAANAIANNYDQNMPTPISSDQGDMRIDQNITSKQTAFARFTYKHRDVEVAPTPGGSPTGSALLGPFSEPEIDYGLTVAYNVVFTPTVINEVRTGFNGNHTRVSFGVSPSVIASELNLTGIPQPLPGGNAVPNFNIAGFEQTGGNASTQSLNNTNEVLDNLTWNKGTHTMKFGGSYSRMTGNSANVYAAQRLGVYNFNGGVTSETLSQLGLAATSSPSAELPYIGNPFAAFLLGIPDKTQLDTVIQPDSHGYANSYGFFGQDDWKVTPHLTVNFGLRWEYHPMFRDHLLNSSNFLPNYTSIIGGQQINGAVVIPNQQAFSILDPAFAASVAPTPIFTAAQVGIPASLRFSTKTDFAPRAGFAWRPFGNDKTVVRGGYGRYIEGPLGSLLGASYAIHSADQGFYNQSISGSGQPSLSFPFPFPNNLAQPGSQFFQQAGNIHYMDPKVDEWNFTLERDIGYGTAISVSYTGSHGSELGVQGNLGQLAPNTIGYAAAQKFLEYPLWGEVETETNGGWSNYNALTASGKKRFSSGLQFQSSYTYTRNLSSAQSYNPSAFATEAGGVTTWLNDIGMDYGNVAYSRRNRFLTTFLYQLPFGKGTKFLVNTNGVVNQIVSGWELSGVLLFQSGPFLTVTVPGADPSGTGFPLITGNGRADIVSGQSLYAASQTISTWLNKAAFAVPPNNIGRFGDAPVGDIQGPGTQAISASLMKSVTFTERLKMQIGAQAANLFNHENYAPPNTVYNTASFGTISGLQTAEGAGPRTVQITARILF